MSIPATAARLLNPPEDAPFVARLVDLGILVLIVTNVAAFIVGTVPSVQARWGNDLDVFETASVLVFSIEYLARLWAAPAHQPGARPRTAYATSALGIVDLIAIIPFYLSLALPAVGVDLRVLRALRLLRTFRALKLARHSVALQTMGRVLRAKRHDLVVLVLLISVIFVFASSALYYAEGEVQPESFGSIPVAMWWCIVTLTTVGYGDAFPVTGLGRVLAAITMLLAIGVVALPTGILGAAFTEEIMKARTAGRPVATCPHCGGDLTPE